MPLPLVLPPGCVPPPLVVVGGALLGDGLDVVVCFGGVDPGS
jgi:hypothetical protein